MKRGAPGGDSPVCKQLLSFQPPQEADDYSVNFSQSKASDSKISSKLLDFNSHSQELSELRTFLLDEENTTTAVDTKTDNLDLQKIEEFGAFSSNCSIGHRLQEDPLSKYLDRSIANDGISATAATLLKNKDLKKELLASLLKEAHKELKSSLSKSQVKKTHDRTYLLTLTPRGLCEEYASNAPLNFEILTQGILGIDREKVFQSQKVLNIIALFYSTASKYINRKATAFALMLTTVARDGGLREDSLSVFSCFVHPRTSQTYDKEVLAVGWDSKVSKYLKEEKDYFERIRAAQIQLETLQTDRHESNELNVAEASLESLLDDCPLQLQLVWDNINLTIKHR